MLTDWVCEWAGFTLWCGSYIEYVVRTSKMLHDVYWNTSRCQDGENNPFVARYSSFLWVTSVSGHNIAPSAEIGCFEVQWTVTENRSGNSLPGHVVLPGLITRHLPSDGWAAATSAHHDPGPGAPCGVRKDGLSPGSMGPGRAMPKPWGTAALPSTG